MDTIKLPPQSTDSIFGFFLTSEGRKALKMAYQLYHQLAVLKPESGALGHTAMAEAIADDAANFRAERKTTDTILRRWAETNQAELWLADADKNLRVLRKLEEQVMLQPEIADRLRARAKTIFAVDTGNALSLLCYSRLSPSDMGSLRKRHAQYEGIYQVIQLSEEASKSSDPPNVHISRSATYFNIVNADDHPFLLFQEFVDTLGGPPFKAMVTGFCFVSHNGIITRFSVPHSRPQHRLVETFTPITASDRRVLFRPPGGFNDGELFAHGWVRMYGPPSNEIQALLPTTGDAGRQTSHALLLRRDASEAAMFYRNRFHGLKWTVPL